MNHPWLSGSAADQHRGDLYDAAAACRRGHAAFSARRRPAPDRTRRPAPRHSRLQALLRLALPR